MAGVSRTLSYQYDLEGDRTRITHPLGFAFSYGFDGLNRFCSLNEGATSLACDNTAAPLRVTYRPGGGRASIARAAGGAVTALEPDNAQRLWRFTQNFTGTTNDLTNQFTYNAASQVTQLSQSNTQYTYAEFQSRVGVYVPNGLNQYTSVDEAPLGHDANGNLTSDGAGAGLTTYTYDMENHLVVMNGTVNGVAVSANLTYDVLGRLAQTSVNGTVTEFEYDGDALVAEYQGGTLTRRYVHGDQVDEPLMQYTGVSVNATARRYLHSDHQGSIIAQSDKDGAVTAKLAYDSYGIPASTNVDRFGYTGQTSLKELGLNYYKARIYSPRLGRFLQTDPIFYKDDMDLYAYVGGDPMNRADPSGQCPWCLIGALAGASVSAIVQYTTTGKVDIQQVGIAAAAGFISGGVSAIASATLASGAAIVTANTLAGGAIGAGQTVASTYAATGTMPTNRQVAEGAVVGAVLSGTGAGVGVAADRAAATATNGIKLHIQEMTQSAMLSSERNAAATGGAVTGDAAAQAVQSSGELTTGVVSNGGVRSADSSHSPSARGSSSCVTPSGQSGTCQ